MIMHLHRLLRPIAAGLAIAAMMIASFQAPANAQFGGLLPRDVRNVTNDATSSDSGCEEGEKKSVGSKVLGGIFGRTVRKTASDSGVSRWVPVGEFSDQLSTEIACRLDPAEQKQAAEATLKATRSLPDGGDDTAPSPVAVGSSASWKSETRDDVSGTSTVVSRDASGGDLDCITVTDVVIVKGEETTANKRMCRPPGSRRYSIIA